MGARHTVAQTIDSKSKGKQNSPQQRRSGSAPHGKKSCRSQGTHERKGEEALQRRLLMRDPCSMSVSTIKMSVSSSVTRSENVTPSSASLFECASTALAD